MTTIHTTDEIKYRLASNHSRFEPDATGMQEATPHYWGVICSTPQGDNKIIQLVLSQIEPPVSRRPVEMASGVSGIQNLGTSKMANRGTYLSPSLGGRVRLRFHNGTETTPPESYFQRAVAIEDLIWLNPLRERQTGDTTTVQLPSEVEQFKIGIDGEQPKQDVIDAAIRVALAAKQFTIDPEFFLDSDGSLSYDLRLSNGQRAMVELTIQGDLDAGFYDDNNGEQHAREVRYLARTTAEALIQFLQ